MSGDAAGHWLLLFLLLFSCDMSHDTDGRAADSRWKPDVVGQVVRWAAVLLMMPLPLVPHRFLLSIFLACERSEGTFPSAIVLCCVVLCCVVSCCVVTSIP